MAIFTKINPTNLKALVRRFPTLPQSQFRAKGIALGTVNTFYRLNYASGETFYLKIDEVGSESRLKNEILVFENLQAQSTHLSFAIPYPLIADNGKRYVPFQLDHGVTIGDTKFTLVLPELKGVSYYKHDLTPTRLCLIGKKMAEWHSLRPNSKIPEHRFNLAGQKKVFQEIKIKLAHKHPELCRFITKKLTEFTQLAPKHEKLTLIHADLFPENILWIGNRLNGILDLDAAGRGSPLFDIGVCVHALCHDGKAFQLAKICAFLRGYDSVRKLTSQDKKSLPYYLDLSAMRFLLTRLRDFELAPQGRKVEPFKDYRQYADRFAENLRLKIPQ